MNHRLSMPTLVVMLLICQGLLAQDAANQPLRIPLRIDAPTAQLGERHPMYCGVPFGRDELTAIDNLHVVDSSGQVVPTQLRILARWPQSDSIRWLAVDFLGNPDEAHVLERRPDHLRPRRPARPLVQETIDHYRIDTGPALFLIPKQGPLLSAAWLDVNGDGQFSDHEQQVHNETGDDLYVIDNEGRHAIIGLDEEPGQTRAEPPVAELALQADQVHACIRREGWYVTADGDRVARHITRLHAYRGQASIRIEHSLILTEDTQERWFRDIGFTVRHRQPVPHPVLFAIAPEGDTMPYIADLQSDAETLSMFQEKAYFYSRTAPEDCAFQVQRSDSALAADAMLYAGERCGDWIHAAGANGGVTLAVRQLWQQFPKEMAATPGALTARLWSPRGGRELDLRIETLLETWPKEWLNEAYHGSGSYGVYYRRILNKPSNGLGMARTHEMLLALHPPRSEVPAIRRTADAFSRPVRCLADPQQLWKSEAMGPVYPYDAERFPLPEGFMEAYFDAYLEQMRSWGDYGWLDFGSGPHVWYRLARSGPLEGRWMPYLARYAGQIDYGFHAHLWRMYARSGQRKYAQLAEELNRQRIDAGMIHWDSPAVRDSTEGPLRGKVSGLFAGADSPVYWGNGSLHHQSGTDLSKLYWYHYLRDYRFAGDAAEAYRGAVKRLWARNGMGIYGSRPFAVLNCLATLYQETGDLEILAIGRAGLESLVDLESPRGVTDTLATGLAKYDVKLNAVANWYRATGDELAAKSVLRGAHTHVVSSMGESPFYYYNSSGDYLNLAWRLSGDPAYLRALVRNLEIAISGHYHEPSGTWRNLSITSASNNRYPMGGMAAALDAIVRHGEPIEPIPQVQQIGPSPATTAVVRKAADEAVELYVRSRVPIDPLVQTLDGRAIAGLEREAITARLAYTAPATESPASYRLTIPASLPAGDYQVLPGSDGENWEITWSTAAAIVLYAPDGFVTGAGRVWDSWPPHRFSRGTPILAKPQTWYFQVPQPQQRFMITTSGPIELTAPDGSQVTSVAAEAGTFEITVPDATSSGFWRLYAEKVTTVKIEGVPPFFAADDPARYMAPAGMLSE